MKNLVVFVHPEGILTSEALTLLPLQIDNSLDLGWQAGDIVLLTNFPYEYRGVKAQEIGGESYCPFRPLSTKTITVANTNLPDETYWVHDLDAFQLVPFTVELNGYDAGLTDYGWSRKWNLGSYFYTNGAKDIFQRIRDTVYRIENEDERALMHFTKEVEHRIKRLNITYNLGYQRVEENLKRADLPLRVAHFHPKRQYKNFRKLLPERLLGIFYKYGYV